MQIKKVANRMKVFNRTGLFERALATNWRKASTAVLIGVASLFGLFAITGTAGVRINTTPSLPVGLYIEADTHSNLVEFCPVGPSAVLAVSRGYRTVGNCPDGASPLLKPVIAKAGDVVELTAAGITVDSQLIPNTAPLSMDTEHRVLEHFRYGRYVVAQEEVWVASSYNRRSFDSRYYGPVPARSIRAHLRALLTL